MHSIIQSGLIPGGNRNRGDRQSVFFTAVNPTDTQPDRREVEYDLDKPRIAPYKHTWRALHNTVCWWHLKLAQRKGLRFHQTRSHAITLSDTPPAIWIVKVVCMKIREELYCRVCKSPRLLGVTLVLYSQHNQQDVHVSESRKSDDRGNEVHQHRETCGSDRCVDFRIPGIPHSAVEQVETNRKKKFDDELSNSRVTQTGTCCSRILRNRRRSTTSVSNQSIYLITEMGNYEIFEFYETSSMRQRPDCALDWEFGIVFCTCGKCMQPTAMNRQHNKDRYDSLSIPGYVKKKRRTNPEVLGMVNQCVK